MVDIAILANINLWVVGGERPFNFSIACRISFRTLAPVVVLIVSDLPFFILRAQDGLAAG